MNEQSFRALVAKLENESRSQPRIYRFKVASYAVLGYGYVLLLLAFFGLALYFSVDMILNDGFKFGAVKLALVSAGFLFILVKAIWVKLPEPEGRELRKEEAPKLFQLLDKIRANQSGPPIDRIIVDNNFNAAIAQIPRLGPLGWYRNTLIVGLPFMQATNVSQFAAVLAHEYGHLSGSHGKFSAWIYRIRRTWGQLLDKLQEDESWLTKLVRLPLNLIIPRFQAYSFVLARQGEYEADKAALDFAGARAKGEALILSNTIGEFYQDSFWKHYWRQSYQQASPQKFPYQSFPDAIRAYSADSNGQLITLNTALAQITGVDDTHPALKDRLSAIGHKPSLTIPAKLEASAASLLLGHTQSILIDEFDKVWSQNNMQAWKDQYADAQREIAELKQLRSQLPDVEDSMGWLKLGKLEEVYGVSNDARNAFQKAVHASPENAEALFQYGRILVEADDPSGLQYLDKAMLQDIEATPAAASLGYRLCKARNLTDKADEYEEKYNEYARKN